MSDCQNCPLVEKIKNLEEDSRRNQETHKEFYNRFENQTMAQAVTDERYNTILNTLTTLTGKVDALSADPGDKWKTLTSSVISGFGGGLIGFIASMFLK